MWVLILFLIFTNSVSAQIKINEIHPNPESGPEWIELYFEENEENQTSDIENYSLEDSYHQIYLFSDEVFDENNLLMIEVSGLNNDEDQVVLKDSNEKIIDQFSYTKTEKGLSWSWSESLTTFQLTTSSKNEINPELSLTPTEAVITPTATTTPETIITPDIKKINKTTNTEETAYKPDYQNYIPSKIKLKTDPNPFLERKTRMVFLQEREDKKLIINAIIGGSLISISAYYLLYVRIKKN